MNYILSFNVTFFSLVGFTVAMLAAGLIAMAVAKKRGKRYEFARVMHDKRHAVHGLWVAVLLLSAWTNLAGTSTYLFWCVIAGFVIGGLAAYLENVRVKRQARESVEQAMRMMGLGS